MTAIVLEKPEGDRDHQGTLDQRRRTAQAAQESRWPFGPTH